MCSRFSPQLRRHLRPSLFSLSSPSADLVTFCGCRCCNPGENVNIMLAVWCFTVFAAVGERLAVSGKGERRAGDLLVSFASRVFFPALHL